MAIPGESFNLVNALPIVQRSGSQHSRYLTNTGLLENTLNSKLFDLRSQVNNGSSTCQEALDEFKEFSELTLNPAINFYSYVTDIASFSAPETGDYSIVRTAGGTISVNAYVDGKFTTLRTLCSYPESSAPTRSVIGAWPVTIAKGSLDSLFIINGGNFSGFASIISGSFLILTSFDYETMFYDYIETCPRPEPPPSVFKQPPQFLDLRNQARQLPSFKLR